MALFIAMLMYLLITAILVWRVTRKVVNWTKWEEQSEAEAHAAWSTMQRRLAPADACEGGLIGWLHRALDGMWNHTVYNRIRMQHYYHQIRKQFIQAYAMHTTQLPLDCLPCACDALWPCSFDDSGFLWV
jgi:hypothetical protein